MASSNFSLIKHQIGLVIGLALLGLIVLFSVSSNNSVAGPALKPGSIYGQVSDLQGHHVRGLFLSARNRATGGTTYVLSQDRGRFQIPNLPAGEYDALVKSRGWEAQPQQTQVDGSKDPAMLTFKVKRGAIYTSELTSAELLPLLPDGHGREVLLGSCVSCHTLRLLTRGEWTTDRWREITREMIDLYGAQVPEGKEELLANYLSTTFAPQSQLRQMTQNMVPEPARPIDVVYTAWDIPLQNALPHTATYDGNGNVWFTDALSSRIGYLDVTTGKFKIWNAPTANSIPHGIVVDKKGMVWFTERLHLDPANKIVKFDPQSEKFVEYPLPQKESGPHTLIFDRQGILWISEYEGNRIARFDPETEKFTEYQYLLPGVRPQPYALEVTHDDKIWLST